MTKLTQGQIQVLEDMRRGWALKTTNVDRWLAKLIDERMETRTVRSDTVFALEKKGHIEIAQTDGLLTTWKLVEL